jgi:transaldolase
MTDALKLARAAGVAIWLDDLSRKRITSGNLADLIDESSTSSASPPTRRSSRRRSPGRRYDEQVAEGPRRPRRSPSRRPSA